MQQTTFSVCARFNIRPHFMLHFNRLAVHYRGKALRVMDIYHQSLKCYIYRFRQEMQ